VPVNEMTTENLVRAVLLEAPTPLRPKEINDRLGELRVKYNPGSIANIGTRLAMNGVIDRTNGAWKLVKRNDCPVLHEGMAWGNLSAFDVHELAAHRRLAISHVLRAHHDGLQVVQLVRVLENCDWFNFSINKGVVKIDLQEMQKAVPQLARKMAGHSGKWEAA
jgi:hypothetical protein